MVGISALRFSQYVDAVGWVSGRQTERIFICLFQAEKNNTTGHGTLNRGAKTAEPALPYSNALMSCGNTLSLQNDVGNKSRDEGRLLKKLFFASCS